MGTVKLFHQCKDKGSLPNLSDILGDVVRTNSETLVGVKANDGEDYSKGIAITSGIYPDEHTHIETVRYAKGQDAMSGLATILTDGKIGVPRQISFLTTDNKTPISIH